MGIARKRILRFAGGPKTASKKLSASLNAAAARKVLSGYPVETAFSNRDEVLAYLNSDRITCLRCGKSYNSLGRHLSVHSWTVDQYKEFYGLPWRMGLTSLGSTIIRRSIGLQLVADGLAFGDEPGMNWEKALAAPRRRRVPYMDNVGQPFRKIWQVADYWRIPQRMLLQDRTRREVCGDKDMPGRTATKDFARAHVDFRLELNKASGLLSFPAQARGEQLGARFRNEVNALEIAGLARREIARKLSVSKTTVDRFADNLAKGGPNRFTGDNQFRPGISVTGQ